jgi:hypothetical protein
MRKMWLVGVLAVGLAVVAAGCAAPPQADIDAVKVSADKAATAGAAEYAADSLKAAQDAQAALEAELKVQADKFTLFRSYTKATELAGAAKTAAEKAEQDAVAGKEKAKNEATALIEEAKTALTAAQEMLAKAPKGKGTAADLEAMKADLAGAEISINDANTAMGAERYLEAKAKAEAAKNVAGTVSAAVQAAIDARKGR